MPFIADRVFDNGLSDLSNVNKVVICSQEPTTFTEANATYDLGNKTSPTVGSPSDRSPSGRKVTVSAITDGTVTDTGTGTHFAGVDTVNSRLYYSNALSASQSLTSGNTFSLTAHDIGIPDAA